MENRIRQVVGLPERTAGEPPPRGLQSAPTDSSGRISPTNLTLVVVLVMAVFGAIVGAALKPLTQDRFLADAVIGIESTSNADAGTRAWRTFADTIELPQVAQAAASSDTLGVKPSEIPTHVEAVGDPQSSILRVRARADSPASAASLANAVTAQAMELTRSAARQNLIDTSSRPTIEFEDGVDGFTASTRFTTTAQTLRRIAGGVAPGAHALGFSCAQPRPGCGPGEELIAPFTAGATYVATARVRSFRGAAGVRLVLGASVDDVGAGTTSVVQSNGYVPLRVAWTPRRTTTSAVVALQTTTGKRVDMGMDDVALLEPTRGRLDPGVQAQAQTLAANVRARRTAEANPYIRVAAATPNGTVRSDTAGAAALGAGGAALVALAGLLLARQARRREH